MTSITNLDTEAGLQYWKSKQKNNIRLEGEKMYKMQNIFQSLNNIEKVDLMMK